MEVGHLTDDSQDLDTADFFKYGTSTEMVTASADSYWTTQATNALRNNMVLGIPLGLTCPLLDGNNQATTCSAEVSNANNMVNWGGDQGDSTHGKSTTGRAHSFNDMGLYWAIQDQEKTWWEYDHIVVQTLYQEGTADSYLTRLTAGGLSVTKLV